MLVTMIVGVGDGVGLGVGYCPQYFLPCSTQGARHLAFSEKLSLALRDGRKLTVFP